MSKELDPVAPGLFSWLGKVQDQAKEMATKAADLAKQTNDRYKISDSANEFLSNIISPISLDRQYQNESNQSLGDLTPKCDLNYVTENLMSMSFPYNIEVTKKNSPNEINAAAAFLRKRHSGHSMIWNVSEESYDYSCFADQVLEYKFPGHPSPPLGLLFKICTSVESWLDADEKNVAVIHCLTGKGRTSAILACILTWMGEFSSPVEALQYVADCRNTTVDLLTIPSQRRYVQYFSNMLDGVKPRTEPLLLRRCIFNIVPKFDVKDGGGSDASRTGCCPYIQLFKNGQLIANAMPPSSVTSTATHQKNIPTNSKEDSGAVKSPLTWVMSTDGAVSFSVDCVLRGDILLRCRHASDNGSRVSMFRAAFHTGYVPAGVLRLTKAMLDGANTDDRFTDDFFLDLIFAPVDSSNNNNSTDTTSINTSNTSNSTTASDQLRDIKNITFTSNTSSSSTGSSSVTDSGASLVFDAQSKDSYDQLLHRDARFWEAVYSRKTRSRKRRSRKFLSSTQDQFSISDESSPTSSAAYRKSSEISDNNNNRSSSILSSSQTSSLTSVSVSANTMSDLELIQQLVLAEDDNIGLSTKTTSTTIPVVDTTTSTTATNSFSLNEDVVLADSDIVNNLSTSTTTGTPQHSKNILLVNDTSITNNITATTTTTTTTADSELMALEELEKELGLDGMNIFSTTGTTTTTTSKSFKTELSNHEVTSVTSANKGVTEDSSNNIINNTEENVAGGVANDSLITEDNLDELEEYLQSLTSSQS